MLYLIGGRMRRIYPICNGQIYHVFNRGQDERQTFTDLREYRRILSGLEFYCYGANTISFSRYLALNSEQQAAIRANWSPSSRLVEVIAYCIMPNHFHLLLRQVKDDGISRYLGQLQNSYTRYYNLKHARKGTLFLPSFKAVRIETAEQLSHVSRYIHLNPSTAYLVKTPNGILSYPWSSLPLYIKGKNSFITTAPVLSMFNDVHSYCNFVLNQADYQKSLKSLEHLLHEGQGVVSD